MKARLIVGATTIAVFLGVAASGIADPNLGDVSPHRHWIQTPSGAVQVGPRVCDDPNLQEAFNQFHNNVHAATTGGLGPVAPGLHNFTGADLFFTGC